jgi:hypothetical protein
MLRTVLLLGAVAVALGACAPRYDYRPSGGPPPPISPSASQVTPPPPPIDAIRPKV